MIDWLLACLSIFYMGHILYVPSHWCFLISYSSLKGAQVLMIIYRIYLAKTQRDHAASVIWSKN